MDKILNVIGIILVMIGTVFSLWSILSTKEKYYGTCEWFSNLSDDFKKDKKKVIIGIILIVMGSILQIIGLFL